MNWQITYFDHHYGTNHQAPLSCLLIPGWSMDSTIFDVFKQGLGQYFQVYTADYQYLSTVDEAVESLAEDWPCQQPMLVIGWSLGGNIALAFAEKYPEKVAALCLLASSPSFVENADWLAGMAANTFQAFAAGVAKQPAKTLRRFDALQSHGDKTQALLDKALKTYREQQQPWSDADLKQGLLWLEQSQQCDILRQLQCPQLWCFGEADALINKACAEAVKALNTQAQIAFFEHAGHLLFLSQPDAVLKALLQFLQDEQKNKQKIAKAFSQAAENYDKAAKVQAWAGQYLLGKTAFTSEQLVLDAGCGTARHSQQLSQKTQVIGSDIALGMLQYAKTQSNVPLVNADSDYLPFADASLDGIFSNLAVQWSAKPRDLLKEWYRVLKPGGKVYFSTLVKGSLFELQKSFSKADNAPHINVFASAEQWQDDAQAAQFNVLATEPIKKVDEYASVADVLRSLKNIGAQTVVFRQNKGLMSKKRWQVMEKT